MFFQYFNNLFNGVSRIRCGSLGLTQIISIALFIQCCSVFLVSTAAAQSSNDSVSGVLEEIVVTARKRVESLQETPIAVSAFSGDALEKRSLTNLMEVGAHVPNVSMSTGNGGGGNNGQIYIRGIGQSDFLFTTDPGVGIYIDGVYHPRSLGAVMDLLDLERVEVLRGPQGTLFGKNTVGGALNVVSAKPTGEFGGRAEATFGRYDRTEFRGGIDFAISETLFAKAALSYKNRDGYGKRIDFVTGNKTDETGDENQTSGRLALRWLASDDVTVDVIADYTHEDEKSVAWTLLQVDDTGAFGGTPTILWNALIGTPGGLPYSSAFITGERDTTFATGANTNELDAWGINATIEWDLDWATAKSITAYREMEGRFGQDGDNSPLPINGTDERQEQDQISQEIQLFGSSFDDRVHWLAGFFYFNEFGRDANDVRLTSGLFNALEALPGTLNGSPLTAPTAPGGPGNPINLLLDLDFDVFNEIDITSMAAFAQGTFDVTDKLSITGGFRYTYEKKDYFLEHRRVSSNTFVVPATSVEDSWNEPTYLASLQYQWTDNLMTYFSFSRGFKSGGFNGRPTVSAAVSSFDPEYLDAYEIGLKSEWLDRRLRLNMAAYYYDYTDLQFTAITADTISGALLLVVDNVATAEVKGFEIEMQALPTENLELNASVGYTDFEITEVAPGVRDVTTDTTMLRTPEWTASANVQYTFPQQGNGIFRIRGDWTYEDDSFGNINNTPSLAREEHSLFSARLTWELPDSVWGGGWELTAFGTNLTDKRVVLAGTSTLSSFGNAYGIFNRPREWGVTIKKSF